TMRLGGETTHRLTQALRSSKKHPKQARSELLLDCAAQAFAVQQRIETPAQPSLFAPCVAISRPTSFVRRGSLMKVAVMGVAGRMGQELVRAAHAAGCSIVGGIEREGSPAIGSDVGIVAGLPPLGVPVTSDAIDVISRCDGILDFTSPKATVEFAGLAANARAVHVIGTTGLSADDEAHIAAAARHAPIIKAGNMSLGVNLLAALARRVAEALDEDFDIEIVEMHHRDKVDAPSGTALMLGAAAADGRAINLAQRSVRVRDGVMGPRNRGDIGFAT